MKNKILFSTVLFLFLIAINLISINALTLNTPANGVTITQNMTLNLTAPANEQLVNCTFYAKSSLTANSSWSNLGFFKNVSYKDAVNGTFNSTILEDANNYQFNATCRNYTNQISDVTGTATVIVDNTVPTTPTSLTPSDNVPITTTGTQTLQATVTDSKTTSCTYKIARGGASSGDDYFSGTATYSASTCSFTKAFSTSADNGNWIWTITASDETNTTSANAILPIAITGGGSGVPIDTEGNPIIATSLASTTDNSSMWLIVGFIFIIIVGIVIYYNRK